MLSVQRVNDFYLLGAMKHDLSSARVEERGKIKLKEKVSHNLEYLTTNLARAFYDYILLASAGESRHAQKSYTNWYFIEQLRGEREDSYDDCKMFNPDELRDALIKVFERENWRTSGYGNKSWQKIASASQYYGKWPDGVFVDYCVDLHHNGGNMFNKPVKNYMDFDVSYWGNLQWFLNLKREHNILRLTYEQASKTNPCYRVTSSSMLMYKKWCVFNNFDPDESIFCKEDSYDTPYDINTYNYVPIEWGNTKPIVLKKYRKGVNVPTDQFGNVVNGKTVTVAKEQSDIRASTIYHTHAQKLKQFTNWRAMKKYLADHEEEIDKQYHKAIINSFRYCVVKGKERTKLREQVREMVDMKYNLHELARKLVIEKYQRHKTQFKSMLKHKKLIDAGELPEGLIKYVGHGKLLSHPCKQQYDGYTWTITQEHIEKYSTQEEVIGTETVKKILKEKEVMPSKNEIEFEESFNVTDYIEKVSTHLSTVQEVQNER